MSSAPLRAGVASQALALAAATGAAQLLTAVLYILAARGSSPAHFGEAVTAIAIATAGAGFLDFGTNNYWVRELARGTNSIAVLGSRARGKIAISSAAALIWVITTALLFPGNLIVFAGLLAALTLATQTAQVPLRAQRRGHLASISVISERLAASVIFIALAYGLHLEPALALCISLSCAPAVSATLTMFLTPNEARRAWVNGPITLPWRGAHFYGLTTLAISAQALDVALLSAVGGAKATGIYGGVSRWTQPMGLLAAAFASASAPFVAHSGSIHAAWAHIRRAVWMPLAGIAVCALVVAFAPMLVPLLLGQSYADSVVVLQILAVAAALSVVCQPLLSGLQALGHDRQTATVMASAVALQLAFIATTGRYLGAMSAAWASCGAQALIFALLLTLLVVIRRQAPESARAETDLEGAEGG